MSNKVASHRGPVMDAREEMIRLADTLEAPRPLSPRGLALTWTLMSDGTGPLYYRDSDESLSDRLIEVLTHIEV
jgi:hypothetical protein